MENDIHQVCREKQDQFICDVMDELYNLFDAYERKVRKKDDLLVTGLKGSAELEGIPEDVSRRWKGMASDLECVTFSGYTEKLQEVLRSLRDDLTDEVSHVLSKRLPKEPPVQASPSIQKDGKKYLDPDFEFSEDIKDFKNEYLEVLAEYGDYRDSCSSNKSSDPQIDFAISKVLFQAGFLIGKFKEKGIERSDKKSNIGSRPKKNRYNDDDIGAAFYKCEEKRMWPMQNAIWSFLNDQKKRTNSKKDVPSTSTIKRTLEKKGLDKKLAK
jgi:hypothetical protein